MAIEPQLTDEQREALLHNVTEVYASFAKFAEALLPQLRAVAETFAELGRQLKAAGLIDEDGQPTKRPNRPAWQSPYGPPKRRN